MTQDEMYEALRAQREAHPMPPNLTPLEEADFAAAHHRVDGIDFCDDCDEPIASGDHWCESCELKARG